MHTVVIAAGSWSRQVGDVFGLTIPVEPAKGQMLAVLRHNFGMWSLGMIIISYRAKMAKWLSVQR